MSGNYHRKRTLRLAVFQKLGGRCWYCGIFLEQDTFHVDHADPLSRGGWDCFDNMVPSCPECNTRKAKKTIEEFRDYMRRRCDEMPSFNEKQMAWLKQAGMDVLEHVETLPQFTFEYEREGLSDHVI